MANDNPLNSIALLEPQSNDTAAHDKLEQLASKLTLTRYANATCAIDDGKRLALVDHQGKLGLVDLSRTELNPLVVDFESGQISYRRQHAHPNRELIAKAVGVRHNRLPTVLDSTAGLGRDSFVLACLGCQVTLIEQHPIVHALLADGMARAATEASTQPIIARMQLIHSEATDWMQCQADPAYDVVSCDPMFPARAKSAAIKKNMQLLQLLVGYAEENEKTLLTTALTFAKKRVVVKRPKLAPPIDGSTPNWCIEGKSGRFDCYGVER